MAEVVLAIVALVLCAPLLLVLAVLVKLSERGSVIEKLEGVDFRGRPAKFMRFRTSSSAGDPPKRLSRFLRSTSLDELPALLSVLTGDFSLWASPSSFATGDASKRPRFRVPRSPLSVFRYFVSRETRELVDDCLGDIRRDAREMNRKKVARGWIHAMVWWKSWSCMASIVWEGVKRTLARVLPGAALWRRLTAGDR